MFLRYFNFCPDFLVVWQCHKNDPDANITDSKSFKFKAIMTIKNLVGDNTKVTHCTKKMKFSSKNFFSKCDQTFADSGQYKTIGIIEIRTETKKINWNKYQLKVSKLAQKQYFDYLIDPSFQGANRLFVLLFKDNAIRRGHTRYFLTNVGIKVYNALFDGQNIFDQPVKNEIRT